MNSYALNRSVSSLSAALANWLRSHQGKAVLPYNNLTGTELRLTPLHSNCGGISYIDQPGCTLTLKGLLLQVSCVPSLTWIEKAVLKALRKTGINCTPIFTKKPSGSAAVIRALPHPPRVQTKTAAPSKPKKKAEPAKAPSKFHSVEEACKTAERDAKGWIVITNRAWSTAKDSNYVDPDYVYDALIALSRAAFLNSKGGLNQSWEFHLKTNGPHNYCAHSSEGTLAQFPGEYHVNHGGRRYCIESHIKRGNGSGSDAVRIYLCQPATPGQPVIVGSVGPHLPILTRGH
jgi:hypothetical protein